MLDKAEMRRRTRELLGRLNAAISPDTPVSGLGAAAMQMVEVARALACSCRVLIMDEPTTVLSQEETSTLFRIVRSLRDNGTSFIFISHKLHEVMELCDRVAVLRDGELVSCSGMDGLDEAELARRMVGHAASRLFPERPPLRPDAEMTLEVEGLSVRGLLHGVSFSLRAGEMLGFAGLMGAGRTEMAETIYGLRKATGGTIRVFGKTVRIGSPRQALDAGIAYLSEDRQGAGILTAFSLAFNISLPSLARYCHPFISFADEKAAARKYMEAFHIKAPGEDTAMEDLSGGNQQKAAIARGLDCGPRIFIFDEPTRGIDIQAKSEVYSFIAALLEKGMACILISSDMEEIIGMCRRVAVMRGGRIEGILEENGITEENIMMLASGLRPMTNVGPH